MLFLIFPYRHEIGMVNQYVNRHQGWVGEETGIYTLVGLVADNLFFDFIAVGIDAECFCVPCP